jgi:glutamate/tyrosine decarboxylase-like PLP-dependent enzyme
LQGILSIAEGPETGTVSDQELPAEGAPLNELLNELVESARPGLVASAGPRYFGFVTGGSTDAALVADVMTTGWNRLAFNVFSSPASLGFEGVAGSCLKDLLGIPSSASVGFVIGAQAADTVGLTAARLQVLRDHGWTYAEVEDLFGVFISTVQQHVERGMSKLREAIGGER